MTGRSAVGAVTWLVAASLPTAPAQAQVLEGLGRQAEAAVVHKGGQVIREAIDCAIGDAQCETPPPAQTPAPPDTPESAAPSAQAPGLVQSFTATVTPWITRDAQGWDHRTESVTFTGDAVAGRSGNEHQILLCDPEGKWKGTLRFYAGDWSAFDPGEYSIVTRVTPKQAVLGGFFMPLAATFREGTVTIDASGPDVVTGTAGATYNASKYLRLESGTPPETHEVEAAFQARVVAEITRESAPACWWN